MGSLAKTDLVAANGGTVTETIPIGMTELGFINAWLLLGPFDRAGGANPGEDIMRQDYLTDGAAIDELTVQPVAGDVVHTDFGGAASSTGLRYSTATVNPGGVPTWFFHVNLDDTIDYTREFYGSDSTT